MKRKFTHVLLVSTAGLLLMVMILALSSTTAVSAQNGGYLHTDGNKILNESDGVVRITGVNWFGFETGNKTVHGLWVRNWESVLDQIVDLGYNTVRIPFSREMLAPGAMPDSVDANQNPDLVGLSSMEIFDKIIDGAEQRGLKVILDHHRSNAGVSAQENGLWYTAEFSHEDWIAKWIWLAERYKNNDTVVGMDLHNEPHDSACWGCGDPALDWAMAAKEAGDAVLAVNPDLLIFVEGVECYNPNGSTDPYDDGTDCTWWGGNLLGVQDHPITLSVPNRLVYSPHEYPATVYPQDWFSDPTFPANMPAVWEHYWGYIHTQNIAPLMFGEFGTRYEEETDIIWFDAFVEYMTLNGMHGTLWSLNPNSGDTGGLLMDDWTTVRMDKQAILEPWLDGILGEVPPTPTPNPDGGDASLKLQYQVGNGSATDAQMNPNIQLVNTGGQDIDLSTITMRYWFTNDTVPVNYNCDYAVIGCANLVGSYETMAAPTADANSYMEISFTSGVLESYGQSGIIQNRFARANWSSFDESDDYSYDATQSTLADYDKITVYQNGALVWGVEPSGGEPLPTATSVPPTVTAVPPTETPITPTETAVPPTPTLIPEITPTLTPTAVPPTATPSGQEAIVEFNVVNQWNSGYVGEFTITNNSPNAICDWRITFDIDDGAISNGWGGIFTQVGSQYVIEPDPWNSTIAAGGIVSVGFQASYSSPSSLPSNIELTTELCIP